MPQIKIGPLLFAKEKSMYRNWVAALAREAIQNSVDAGATKIDIIVEDTEDYEVKKVTFSDNGPGMDLATLENVYFVLGETTKKSPTSIGGFGVARMLTAFAQDKYTLRTQDIYVEGCGAEWEAVKDLEYVQGVSTTAWVRPGYYDINVEFSKYLKTCQINATVTFNGEVWTDWMPKNRHQRDLSFGSVYTNKSKDTGIYIRSNGVTMFAPYLSAPFQVIIELDPTRSRSVLQAHRDGLLSEFQSELESFISELNINKQSALRPKRSKSIVYDGTGTFKARRSKRADAEKQVEAFEQALLSHGKILTDKYKQGLIAAPEEKRVNAILEYMAENNIVVPESVLPKHSSGMNREESHQALEMDLFSVVVDDDTNNPLVRKVIESYYPNNWDLSAKTGSRFDRRYGESRPFRAGVDKYKLLVLWKSACEFCLRMLQDELQRGYEEIAWGVGWVFSDDSSAMCRKNSSVYWLLLNPCNVQGKMRYSISKKRDFVKLLSFAAHEVAHTVYNDHDEQFANLLNDLLEEVMANLSEAMNHMKDAKAMVEKELQSNTECV